MYNTKYALKPSHNPNQYNVWPNIYTRYIDSQEPHQKVAATGKEICYNNDKQTVKKEKKA